MQSAQVPYPANYAHAPGVRPHPPSLLPPISLAPPPAPVPPNAPTRAPRPAQPTPVLPQSAYQGAFHSRPSALRRSRLSNPFNNEQKLQLVRWVLNHRQDYGMVKKQVFWDRCSRFLAKEVGKDILHPGRMLDRLVRRRKAELCLPRPRQGPDTQLQESLDLWIRFLEERETNSNDTRRRPYMNRADARERLRRVQQIRAKMAEMSDSSASFAYFEQEDSDDMVRSNALENSLAKFGGMISSALEQYVSDRTRREREVMVRMEERFGQLRESFDQMKETMEGMLVMIDEIHRRFDAHQIRTKVEEN